ncbi:hypothetical protein PR001_g8530 [Phytophthora rubi]|uniref:Uncharacterized protein n=1 Tax=Phytophthora rubi TaxID=129364 RepID=A0A6A3HXR7_9STRA|nr:hypothetical protein PR002_g26466 [Phytophthora rubi]KAE9037073.1 hypothetical protein PR001_g8530 [Phytophthora rubi]
MGVSTNEEKTREYQRLFTDEEPDAMEASFPGQEGTALAGQEIAVEKEEYDKELEDRLFPLDEVEFLKRVKKNAEAQMKPSIEDMAKYLNLPVEVLERTKEASPDEMSSPECWQEWFQNALESSEEAKRANRDFKAVGPGDMQDVPGAAEVVYEDFGLSKRRNNADENQQERKNKEAALVMETDVLASISVPLDCVSDAALSVSPGTTDEEIDPSVARSIARVTVYKNGELVTEGLVERTPDLEEAIKGPPMRDKVPMVAEQLNCDSILGVDALAVFGAVMKEGVATETVKTMSDERLDRPAEIVEAPNPEIPPDKGREADFSDWALILTTGYVVTYSLLSGYDLVETVCLGWFGVASVLLAANYYAMNGQGLVI